MFDFSEWIDARLKERGWSQRDLAKTLEVTETYVSQFTGGRDMPGPELLEKIEVAFDVSPRGALFAHKMMNKIEKVGALAAFIADPSLLSIHGIDVSPMEGRESHAAARARKLAQDGKWDELIRFGLDQMNARADAHNRGGMFTPSKGAPILNNPEMSEDAGKYRAKPKGKKK